MGARISNITKNSPADKSKNIHLGDILVKVNGKHINDVLDYKFYAYDEEITLLLNTGDVQKEVLIYKKEGEDLGLDFDTYLMDRPKSCSNKCIFCFIDQNPKGMRPTIYFKDDDARLSFLLGNYISLTNLSEQDVERMIKMRLSPINVSVQSTNPELRNLLLGNKKGGDSLQILRKFAEAGLTMNCQIVVCQGVNDGQELERSLLDLKALYPAVNSISVVPAGVTKHRAGLFDLKPVSKENAKEIIAITEKIAASCYEEYGTSLAFCGDELYIKAGSPFPDKEYYEEFSQFENGVGMVSLFTHQFLEGMSEYQGQADSFTIATGSASFGFLSELIQKLKQNNPMIDGNVIQINNEFFGPEVCVAGLITGGDLIAGLQGKQLGSKILITANMLRDGGDVFLDDLKISDVEKALHRKVFTVENDGYALLDEIYRR